MFGNADVSSTLAQVFPKGGTCMQAALFHAAGRSRPMLAVTGEGLEIYGTGRK